MTRRKETAVTNVEQVTGVDQERPDDTEAGDALDAGLAQAEMDASTAAHEAADPGHLEDEQAVQDGWAEPVTPPDEDRTPPLVETVETLLFHPHLQPRVKILMLQLVWVGQPMTAPALASGTGLSKTEVFHALKRYVAAGIITESMVPTKQPPWRFDRHYTVTAETRRDLAGLLTKTAADDAEG